jgi:hypothetical protein
MIIDTSMKLDKSGTFLEEGCIQILPFVIVGLWKRFTSKVYNRRRYTKVVWKLLLLFLKHAGHGLCGCIMAGFGFRRAIVSLKVANTEVFGTLLQGKPIAFKDGHCTLGTVCQWIVRLWIATGLQRRPWSSYCEGNIPLSSFKGSKGTLIGMCFNQFH